MAAEVDSNTRLQRSRGVRHTLSNIQASRDYITLYRHPLNPCFDRFSLSPDEVEARLRRGQVRNIVNSVGKFE